MATKQKIILKTKTPLVNQLSAPSAPPAPPANQSPPSGNSLNVIDLFCGCGGMSKGLTDAGLNIIAGIDIWDKAINSYKKNYHHQAICEDLTKLPPDKFNTLYKSLMET